MSDDLLTLIDRLNKLRHDLTTAQSNVTALQASVVALDSWADTVDASLNNIEPRVDTVEDEVSDVDTRLEDLEGDPIDTMPVDPDPDPIIETPPDAPDVPVEEQPEDESIDPSVAVSNMAIAFSPTVPTAPTAPTPGSYVETVASSVIITRAGTYTLSAAVSTIDIRDTADVDVNLNGFRAQFIDIRSSQRIIIRNGDCGKLNLDYQDTVTDLEVDSVDFDGASGGDGGTAMELRVTRAHIHDCTSNVTKYSIWCNASDNVLVENCNFVTAGIESNVRFVDCSTTLTRNCTLRSSLKHFWRVHGTSNINTLYNCACYGGNGVMVASMAGDNVTNCYIINNFWRLGDHSMLELNDLGDVTYLTIRGNQIQTNHYNSLGAYSSSGPLNWTISNNAVNSIP